MADQRDKRCRHLIRISKRMSLLLRHEPERFGLTLDAEGYTSLQDLLVALQSEIPTVTEADIRAVVREVEPDKGRFSLTDSGEIRANYGHSLRQRIEHSSGQPPEVLFHGTSIDALPSIQREGLRPMGRQYVHLTPFFGLAHRIGARHGTPCVLKIAVTEAVEVGIRFYRANASFWLADAIPPQYLNRVDAK